MSEPGDTKRSLWPWLVVGLLLGAGAVAAVLSVQTGTTDFQEREESFPLAEPEVIREWTGQWQRRAGPWKDVPDPPGQGEVVKGRYWLSRAIYDMEVRRRGERFVVAIGGVDTQFAGGGWTAIGEGRVTGDERSFRGAVATFTWSCLSTRFRHMSDGVGRIWFSEDGTQVHTVYVAHEAPALWAKAYGRLQVEGEERPAYATIRGQIPYEPRMPQLAPGKTVDLVVEVVDDRGEPLQHATVQLKGRAETRVRSDARGVARVSFPGRLAPYVQILAAGLPGHFNAETATFTGDPSRRMQIVLGRLDAEDYEAYTWHRAAGKEDPDDLMACGTCHEWYFAEWYTSRHARSAAHGHVTWERDRMLKGDPEAPDDCVGCHQPAHAAADPGATWKHRGTQAGNHCDFCHKIQDVLDVRESGVFGAYKVVRPNPGAGSRPGGIHHVFGPLPDSTFAYMGASYSPLYQESRFCAGCHQGGGRWRGGFVPKINTFEEWRAWVAKQPDDERKTCQQCHMPGASTVSKDNRIIDQLAWDGLHRSADEIHTHTWHATNPQFASRGFQLEVTKERDVETGEWIATVSMTNTGAGHNIPTGTWSKQVVVGVWAATARGPLKQVGGARAWLAPAAPKDVALEAGDWRNPGGFVLGMRASKDEDGRMPTPAFWYAWPGDQIRDARLAPGETRKVACRFEPSPQTPVIEVRVLHRRAWLPRGAAGVPWTVAEYDPAPEVLWRRVIR